MCGINVTIVGISLGRCWDALFETFVFPKCSTFNSKELASYGDKTMKSLRYVAAAAAILAPAMAISTPASADSSLIARTGNADAGRRSDLLSMFWSLSMWQHRGPYRAAVCSFLLAASAHASDVTLSFAPQTGFEDVAFTGDTHESVAIAGRDDAGAPMLALLSLDNGSVTALERPLPEDAVGIDAGAAGPDHQALYILCASRVLRLDRANGDFVEVAAAPSVYRGRSYAPMTSAVDVARDTNGDDQLTPADFTAWINAFNNNLPECAQNGDEVCTPTDFTAWIANFNAGC